MLRAAKDNGYLQDQLAIDPLPPPVRTYYRDQEDSEDAETDEAAEEDPFEE
jgi:hypothetical protein